MIAAARLLMDNRPAIIEAGSEVRKFSQRQKHYLLAERYLQQYFEVGTGRLAHPAETGDPYPVGVISPSIAS